VHTAFYEWQPAAPLYLAVDGYEVQMLMKPTLQHQQQQTHSDGNQMEGVVPKRWILFFELKISTQA